MIKSVKFKNIQKHKDLTLNLSDGINVITGPSDHGKTTILRGLLWAMTNNNSGDKLINNDGAKDCSVTVTADDHAIERSWSKSSNAYSLDGDEFTAFRTDVPKEIKDLLNLDAINIQNRRDLPFMVYYKASECADQFAQMLDITEIDNTITNVNKSVKEKKDYAERMRKAVIECENNLGRYSTVEDADREYQRLREREEQYHAMEQSIRQYDAIRNSYDSAWRNREATSGAVEAVDSYTEIEATVSKIETLEKLIEKLQTLHLDYSFADHTVKSLSKASDALLAIDALIVLEQYATASKIALNAIIDSKRSLVDAHSKAKELSWVVEATVSILAIVEKSDNVKRTMGNLSVYANMKGDMALRESEVAMAEIDYKRLDTKFQNDFPSMCPLCGKDKGDCHD